MVFTTIDEIITKRVLNDITGTLETKDFKQLKKTKKIRGGFRMVYLLYDEAVYQCITSKKDFEIIMIIREKFTYKQIEVELSPTYLAKELNVSRRKISDMLKKMQNTMILLKVHSNSYRFNPYMYLPFRANAEELQKEWKKLIDNKYMRRDNPHI